ncbi:MAG: hypothetical protein V4465_03030 [Patescibacteria group bacterium]
MPSLSDTPDVKTRNDLLLRVVRLVLKEQAKGLPSTPDNQHGLDEVGMALKYIGAGFIRDARKEGPTDPFKEMAKEIVEMCQAARIEPEILFQVALPVAHAVLDEVAEDFFQVLKRELDGEDEDEE